MPNLLTLTSAIAGANLRLIRILGFGSIDEDSKIMVVNLLIESPTGIAHPRLPWPLIVQNGSAEAVLTNPAPATLTDLILPGTLTGSGVATAFDTAFAAYVGGGADKRGAVLTALKGISGTVKGGPLDGQTQPILPPGTVS